MDINWTTIFVGLITATAALSGPLVLSSRQARRESRSVRASILAEIAALIEVIEERGYVSFFQEAEGELKTVDPDGKYELSLQVSIPDSYNKVYQANIGKLGSLTPEEATHVVRFYQLIEAVVADVTPGGNLYEGTGSPEAYAEAARLMNKALSIADELKTMSKR